MTIKDRINAERIERVQGKPKRGSLSERIQRKRTNTPRFKRGKILS